MENKNNKEKKEEDDEEEEEEDDEEKDDKGGLDYTNKNTKKYPKSERKSDISSIPAPSSLIKK